jgi:hypothetical protein
MNCRKIISATLSLAGTLLFASASYAQTPQIMGVGSSGVFTTVGIAAVSPDPITGAAAACGTHFWTAGSSIASGIDARNGSIPAEGGNIWVAWDNDTTPTVVCSYLSVDSVVGQRLFLGQTASGNATLSLTAAAQTTAGANKVSFVKDFCGAGPGCAGLPSAVYTAINGKHFNVAFTDIRPEDGQYAYARASCTRSGVTDASCFGYGPAGGIGTAIASSYSQTSAQVVAYSISGTDPFTGLTIPAIKTISIGGAPVVVFYNTSDATAGGLGNLLPTNINKTTLANIFSGNLGINDELVGLSSGTPKILHVVVREPVSGTYNTFEFQGVHTRDGHGGDYTQEYGFGPTPSGCFVPPSPATFVPPTTACANPANAVGAQGSTYGGFRTRAIGTGEMVNAVSSSNNPNSIGYAFFGLGTFGGKPNLKYLALDGVDPIYPSYSTTNGAFPTCTGFFNTTPAFSCTSALPSFDNVKTGSYRIWSTIRAVIYQSYTNPSSGPSVPALIQAAQDQAHSTIPDIVPSVYCANAACSSTVDGFPAFRSHYGISGIQANNGGNPGYCAGDQTGPTCIEEGGDMAGVPFLDIQDKDFFNLTGNEFLTWIE